MNPLANTQKRSMISRLAIPERLHPDGHTSLSPDSETRRFLDDGRLRMENNASEQRVFVLRLGRPRPRVRSAASTRFGVESVEHARRDRHVAALVDDAGSCGGRIFWSEDASYYGRRA